MPERAERERALVVGADGAIGRELRSRLLAEGWDAIGTTRRIHPDAAHAMLHLDLSEDPDACALPEGIAVAWLLAAQTSQERVRAEPDAARKVNLHHTVRLARRLGSRGALCVFPSTSLVFDGARARVPAGDALAPLGEYARQKAEAERALQALGTPLAIVRIAKVLHAGMPLIRGWIEDLRAGRGIRAFTDQVIAPVPLWFAVEALLRIGSAGSRGVFQVSGADELSYYDLARALAHALGARPELVQAQCSGATGQPRHASLDAGRLAAECGLAAPSLEDTLKSLVAHG